MLRPNLRLFQPDGISCRQQEHAHVFLPATCTLSGLLHPSSTAFGVEFHLDSGGMLREDRQCTSIVCWVTHEYKMRPTTAISLESTVSGPLQEGWGSAATMQDNVSGRRCHVTLPGIQADQHSIQ